jgi:hypothetical protein
LQYPSTSFSISHQDLSQTSGGIRIHWDWYRDQTVVFRVQQGLPLYTGHYIESKFYHQGPSESMAYTWNLDRELAEFLDH